MGNKALVPLELYTSGSNPTVPTPPEGAIYYNSTSNEIRMYSGTTWYASVNTETAQTVGGAKTFTSAITAPSLTVSDANYDTYFDPNTIGIFVTGGADSGASWDVGTTSSRMWMRMRPVSATAGSQTRGTWIRLGTNRWTGAASAAEDVEMWGRRVSDTAGDYKFALDFASVEKFSVDSTGVVASSSYYLAPAATTSIPSIRLPHGAAPSSPTNGDIWTTTAGMYVRINGSTIGPLSSGGGTPASTVTTLDGLQSAVVGTGTNYARDDHKHAITNLVDLSSAQTIGGAKVFQTTSGAPVTIDQYSSNSGPFLKVRTSGGAQLFGVNESVGAASVTVGTELGAQGGLQIYGSTSGLLNLQGNQADAGNTTRDAPDLRFTPQYWNGSTTVQSAVTIRADQAAAAADSTDLLFLSARNVTIQGPRLKMTGVTGATTVTRWVGGTTGSAPASGTHEAGDFVVTTNGKIFICTTGGSPGTWAEVGGSGSSPLTTKGDLYTYTTTNARLAVGSTNGMALVVDSAAASGLKWLENAIPIVLSVSGALSVATGVSRVGVEGSYTILGVRARVDTAPTGTSIKVDVNKNGTTIFSTQTNRPDIAVSTNASSYVTNMNTTTMASGDYFTIDVDQVGSTVAGSHLTVTIWVQRTG